RIDQACLPQRAGLVRIVGRLAVVVVLDEAHGRETAVCRCAPAAQGAVVGLSITLRNDRIKIRRIQRVHAVMPVVAAEATAWQLVLHNVIEIPEAAVCLEFAITENVKGRAQTRGNLIAPSEIDPLKTGARVIRGEVFLIKSQAYVQRQPA